MILLAYGTRPEWIKILPLIKKMNEGNIGYFLLFTGQQENIGNFTYNWRLNIHNGENRLDSIIQSTMNFLQKIKDDNKITHVLVQGDTSSALGIALSAFHTGIKIIHLEAGLRTYDRENPYPEEINRRLISQIADIHLCPTVRNHDNLIHEGISHENVFVVGNTAIDNLLYYKDRCEYTNKVLITLHRRENHHWLGKWFIEIDNLAKKHPELEFILPLHPNPNVQKYRKLLKHVNVLEPLSHDDLLEILIKTRIVITDSGGIQEECSFFNKICLVCRKVTERPEAIGQSTYTVKRPEELEERFEMYLLKYNINHECPFGDGKSAERIIEILKKI